MRAAGESRRSPGPPQAFWPVLVRLNFKSRRQRSERQSAERFYAAAFQRSYRLKGRGVMISARATDPRSPRRRCAPRRSNSKSTRPRSLYPWWRAGPRSCAERRNAGAVIPGPCAAHNLLARGFKPQACSARSQILLLYAAVPRPSGLNRGHFVRWQPRYASCCVCCVCAAEYQPVL